MGAVDAVIRIDNSNVHVDLRGFRINGGAVANHAVLGNGAHITVHNGSVVFTEDAAIDLAGANNSVRDLTLVNANAIRETAIRLGSGGRVADCSLRTSGDIAVGAVSIVARCTFTNQLDALSLGDGSIATDIAIDGIGSVDADSLIEMGSGCVLSRVTIRNAFNRAVVGADDCAIYDSTFSNTSVGGSIGPNTVIGLLDGGHVRNVRISSWGTTAIAMNSGIVESTIIRDVTGTAIDMDSGRVEGCTIIGSATGVDIERRGIIRSTTVDSPSVLGITVGDECLVVDCAVSRSAGAGISLDNNSEARGNRLRVNAAEGIIALSDAHVIGNHLDGDPILITGADNVVDANVITDAFGSAAITVNLAGNLIIRNRVAGDASNFSIAAGNDVGTITSSPVGAGAFDNLLY